MFSFCGSVISKYQVVLKFVNYSLLHLIKKRWRPKSGKTLECYMMGKNNYLEVQMAEPVEY